MRYNKPGTPYYKAAQRIKSNSVTLLEELDNLKSVAPLEFDNHHECSRFLFLFQRNVSPIGDLEPPLGVVDLLTSLDIANDLSIILKSNPLQSLLSYELPETKVTPLTPAPLTHPSRKPKRERRAELVKRRADLRVTAAAAAAARRDAESMELVDPSTSDRPMTEEISNTGTAPTTATEVVLANFDLENALDVEQVLGKRKRTKPAPSQPSPDAKVLTDINPKASFALFDKGWILDPAVRRGGRSPIVQLPQQLPKKRAKGT